METEGTHPSQIQIPMHTTQTPSMAQVPRWQLPQIPLSSRFLPLLLGVVLGRSDTCVQQIETCTFLQREDGDQQCRLIWSVPMSRV